MRRLRYLIMLLLAFRALGGAGLDVTRNYAKNGGGIFGDACTGDGIQKYKYNGKELDRTHGLDTYDYGACMYDAAFKGKNITIKKEKINNYEEKSVIANHIQCVFFHGSLL